MMRQQQSKSGFTLAETMMAMTIGVILLASSYATVMSLAKGSESMINFSEMNGQTRTALELFGRDARMAQDVLSADVNSVRMKWDVTMNGTNYARDVTYEFTPDANTFTRIIHNPDGTEDTRILLYDVEDFFFTYYTLYQSEGPTTNLLDIKHVQIEAKLERQVLRISNTNYIISARFMMRNKDVAN